MDRLKELAIKIKHIENDDELASVLAKFYTTRLGSSTELKKSLLAFFQKCYGISYTDADLDAAYKSLDSQGAGQCTFEEAKAYALNRVTESFIFNLAKRHSEVTELAELVPDAKQRLQ